MRNSSRRKVTKDTPPERSRPLAGIALWLMFVLSVQSVTPLVAFAAADTASDPTGTHSNPSALETPAPSESDTETDDPEATNSTESETESESDDEAANSSEAAHQVGADTSTKTQDDPKQGSEHNGETGAPGTDGEPAGEQPKGSADESSSPTVAADNVDATVPTTPSDESDKAAPEPAEETAPNGESGSSGAGGVAESGDATAVGSIESNVNTNDTDLPGVDDHPQPPDTDQTGPEKKTETPDADAQQPNDDAGAATSPAQPSQKDSAPKEGDDSKPEQSESESGPGASSAQPDPTPPLAGDVTLTASSGSTSITQNNHATITATLSVSASSGAASAAGGGGAASTGDATAVGHIENVFNVNMVDSELLIEFITQTLGVEDFDLRDAFELTFDDLATAWSTPPCAGAVCEDIDMTQTNSSTIESVLDVIAESGAATAGENGTGISGDASAYGQVTNFGNANLVDSNFLLLTFNNLSDYGGDVVLPNASFFEDLFAAEQCPAGSGEMTQRNATGITNDADVGASSGTASAESGRAQSGTASGDIRIENRGQQNYIGCGEFSMLIRVQGEFSGDIFGLPDGMQWEQTPDGIRLYQTGAGGPRQDYGSVTQENGSQLSNTLRVTALSGDAHVGTDGSAESGDAHAAGDIRNWVGMNAIGSNVASLIFNIFGNWTGNLAFGQPDLWMGLHARSSDTPILPGSPITYTYTVFNGGDSDATDVTVATRFATGSLHYPEERTRELGTIAPGETREFSVTAHVPDTPISGEVPLPLSATVTAVEPDGNPDDNEDTVTVYAGVPERDRDDDPSKRLTFPAHFDIEKTASHATATPGTTVAYSVSLTATGGHLFDALLVDIVRDSAGNILSEQTWPLETIKNGEEITIDYDITLSDTVATGTYTNTAQLVGLHASRRSAYQRRYASDIASHDLTVIGEQRGTVAGIQHSAPVPECPRYLTDYLRRGMSNDPLEVAKLQRFLNERMTVGLRVTGIFDAPTEAAVRAFQRRYADDILAPWGATQDTGYVYYTTQQKINELVCADSRDFPLSRTQQREIEAFRSSLEQGTRPVDDDAPIGQAPATAAGNSVAVRAGDDQEDDPVSTAKPLTKKPTPAGQASILERVRGWLWSSVTPLLARASERE